MRSTVEIDHSLFREIKRRAVERGTTFRNVVNELLRRELKQTEQRPRYRLRWKTEPLGRIQPGVRLNDRDSLFDLMDGR